MKFNLLISFIVLLFVSHLRNISIPEPTNMFSYFFLSRKFVVLLLTLRSVISFELLFVYGVRYELRFFLFLFCFEYNHRIVTITFIENITLYWVASTPLLKNQLKNICVGQDSTVHSYFIVFPQDNNSTLYLQKVYLQGALWWTLTFDSDSWFTDLHCALECPGGLVKKHRYLRPNSKVSASVGLG